MNACTFPPPPPPFGLEVSKPPLKLRQPFDTSGRTEIAGAAGMNACIFPPFGLRYRSPCSSCASPSIRRQAYPALSLSKGQGERGVLSWMRA